MVGELGAEDVDLVEAVAAVDRDRGVDVVDDLVVAAASSDVGLGRGREAIRQARHRDLVLDVQPDDVAVLRRQRRARIAVDTGAVVRLGLRERERAHREEVVVVLALETQRRLVRVDGERVVARPALGDERLARARGEPPAGRGDGSKDVLRRQRATGGVPGWRGRVSGRVPLEAVDLTDLERVVPRATVERGDRAVVVDREVVVAAEPVDLQAAVDRGVVVDALDHERRRRQGRRAGRRGDRERRVKQRDEG